VNLSIKPESIGGIASSPVTHDEIATKHRALEKNVGGYKCSDATNALTQALRYFEDNSHLERGELLLLAAIKSKAEQATCTWYSERYDHLLRLTRETVLRSFTAENTDVAQRTSICALAILLTGHAIKWRKFSGNRPDPATREWLHQIFRTAVAFGVDASVQSMRIEQRLFDTTVEALYVRALLLDRFSSGNLAPTRLELLDNWLLAWMGSLWLTREPVPGEPTLGVNTAAPQRGLTPHMAGDGAHLFLSLRPMQRQLDRSIRQFHRGTIFPGWGIGQGVRMEEHVAVINFLEREFTIIETVPTLRSKRLSIGANSIVGVFFGFNEICRMAFAPERLHSLSGGGADIGIRNAIHLVDISDGGLGLDMVEDDARHVNIDDLIAVRLEKGRPCVLGVVVRKSHLQRPAATLIGVKVLTKQPTHFAAEYVDAANTWQPTESILLAGAAADGFADSVIVSEKNYAANALLALTVAGRAYELRMRRVRQQGAGWRMAAFDAAVTL
jgi:hypothetical protein